jgi:hypothetical protein
VGAARLRTTTRDRDAVPAADLVRRDFSRHDRVLNPGVHQPIPDHVHEADEPLAVPGHDPAAAVFGDEFVPVPFSLVENESFERLGVEVADLDVGEAAPPLVDDLYGSNISTRPPVIRPAALCSPSGIFRSQQLRAQRVPAVGTIL